MVAFSLNILWNRKLIYLEEFHAKSRFKHVDKKVAIGTFDYEYCTKQENKIRTSEIYKLGEKSNSLWIVCLIYGQHYTQHEISVLTRNIMHPAWNKGWPLPKNHALRICNQNIVSSAAVLQILWLL